MSVMRQVLQNLRTGVVDVTEVPCPKARAGHLLIQSRASLISAGTERMLVEFGRASLVAKARSQPDKVRQVIDKIKTDGLLLTLEMVFNRLDEPLPLGYCNVGTVVVVGDGVRGFDVGDRVVNNGPHAEMVCVPKNLCAKVPAGVRDEHAAFTVLGAVGMQGIRLLEPTLGESVAVVGLGLIGLIAAQILQANGCRVLGVDLDPQRLEVARRLGVEIVDVPAGGDPVETAMTLSGGVGLDGVLIATATQSGTVVKQAAQMCRKRGRIVLVGTAGLELNRSDFYQKELSFQVSCSYGPGRYDPQYEEKGHDYPIGFVRWTEQRNFEAILALMASGRLDVGPLISHKIPHAEAAEAYRVLTDAPGTLGVVLEYPAAEPPLQRTVPLPEAKARGEQRTVIGMIGAGNFARMTLLPALRGCPAVFKTIASAGGFSALHSGRKYGFEQASTDYKEILEDGEINLVIILTGHPMHAPLVLEALAAGKHVAVEKPLCLTPEELDAIRDAYARCPGRQLLVGLNRRFSPHAARMKSILATRSQPMCMSMMVNAGVIDPDSPIHDPKIGGGRIIAEGCHWIDLMSFLADAPVVRVVSTQIGGDAAGPVRDDKVSITLTLADGSIGTLHYFGNGHKAYPKETLEVFCDRKVLRLENFRILRGYGWRGLRKSRLWRQDKGHHGEMLALVEAVAAGGPPVMPFEQIDNVMKATFAAVTAARTGMPQDVD